MIRFVTESGTRVKDKFLAHTTLIGVSAGAFSIAAVDVGVSLAMAVLSLAICMAGVWWFFTTRYRLKN
jgi:hypothetical protein